MELEKIKVIANEILIKLTPYIKKGEIAGSIRRQKANCKDIDIVILPKSDFISLINIRNLLKKEGKTILDGVKIIRIVRDDGLQIDVYLANEKNYEGILLLKTGSKEHNIKLCSMALKKGWKMTEYGLIINNLIISKEREILEKVFGRWIEPKDRE